MRTCTYLLALCLIGHASAGPARSRKEVYANSTTVAPANHSLDPYVDFMLSKRRRKRIVKCEDHANPVACRERQKSHKVRECCAAQGVPRECLGLCSYSHWEARVDLYGRKCQRYLAQRQYCATNGYRASHCCRQGRVSPKCVSLCVGQIDEVCDYVLAGFHRCKEPGEAWAIEECQMATFDTSVSALLAGRDRGWKPHYKHIQTCHADRHAHIKAMMEKAKQARERLRERAARKKEEAEGSPEKDSVEEEAEEAAEELDKAFEKLDSKPPLGSAIDPGGVVDADVVGDGEPVFEEHFEEAEALPLDADAASDFGESVFEEAEGVFEEAEALAETTALTTTDVPMTTWKARPRYFPRIDEKVQRYWKGKSGTHFKKCCLQRGIPTECRHICRFRHLEKIFKVWGHKCQQYLQDRQYCASNGYNAFACCRMNTSPQCQKVCAGDVGKRCRRTTAHMFLCAHEFDRMSYCQQQSFMRDGMSHWSATTKLPKCDFCPKSKCDL